MQVLLDTHTFLWFISNPQNLSDIAITTLENPQNDIFLSIVSLWEMAIKVSKNKLTLSQPLDTFIPQQLQDNDFNILNISPQHTFTVAKLPFHHRDPFDRLLIAQSNVNNIPIVGRDKIFDDYGIKRIW